MALNMFINFTSEFKITIMQIINLKKQFALLMGVAATAVTLTASAQRYYSHPRNYYAAPRFYAYTPSPVFRPSLHVNLGLGSYGYARPYYGYSRPYFPYVPYGPSIGFRINVLPFGYYPFSFGNDWYYYSNNTFYRRNDDRNYEVVTPPIGAKLPHLPSGAKPVTIDGIKYYELGGTYYQETLNNNNQILYEVVGINGQLNTNSQPQNFREPVEGDVVNQLPENCRTVTVNGQTLYVSTDNIYYQQITDGNRKFYKIVGK